MGIIKTRREIKFFRRAARISNSCIPIIAKSLREKGITERELARRIRRNIHKRGGRLSFKTLIASGERSAMIHAKPTVTDSVISGIGYVDFGASYRGYKTDVTVPFVKGRVGSRERNIVRAVVGAYNIAVRRWRPNMPCWRLHEIADDHIKSKGLRIGHAVGHGVGRKIHERPLIAKPRKKLTGKRLKRWERIKKVVFKPNMVFTIEPGAYVKGVGGSRLENTFVAGRKSLKSLTKSKLIEV